MANLTKVSQAMAELSRLLSAAEVSLGKEGQDKVALSRLLSVAMDDLAKAAQAKAKEVLLSMKGRVKVADLVKEERSHLLLVATALAMAEASSSKDLSVAFNRPQEADNQDDSHLQAVRMALSLDKVDDSLLPPALHLATVSQGLQITALRKAMVAHREVDSSLRQSAHLQVKDSRDAVSRDKDNLSQTDNLLKATVANVLSSVKLVGRCHLALAGRCLEVLVGSLLLQRGALGHTASASLQKRVYNGSISSSLSLVTLRLTLKRLRTRSLPISSRKIRTRSCRCKASL